MKPIRVAWVNDVRASQGMTAGEEAEKEIYALQVRLRYKLHLVKQSLFIEDVEQLDIDLLVFDYGGAASSYSDRLWDQFEAMCRWAHEHPGRLVLLYTGMTGKMYQNLIGVEAYAALAAANIQLWQLPGWEHTVDDDIAQRDKIRAWFTGGDFEPFVDDDDLLPQVLKTPGRR